jgi:UDP-N-acetylmuramoylalanine--D-glutamate ligase
MPAVAAGGCESPEIGAGLIRHAPDVPGFDAARTDDGIMTEVVQAAATLARPGAADPS